MIEFHATPTPFSPLQFAALLETRWLGRPVRHYDRIGSTNSAALALPDAEATHGLLLVADEQSAGRGRFHRPWHAQPGKSLLFTVVLRGESLLPVESALTMAASVALHHGLVHLGLPECEIRWPNDLVANGRKICGILAERGPWATPGWVLGVGLNLNQREEELPPDLRLTATSMTMETQAFYVRETVLARMVAALEKAFELLGNPEGPPRLREQWEQASCVIGRSLAVDTGAEVVRGMVVGLEPSGALILRQDSGMLRSVLAGTVVK